jgi:hypothetical protein
MAKYARKKELIVNTFAFQVFGKRRCDFNLQEMKEYNRLKKRISRGCSEEEVLANAQPQKS